MAVSNNKITAPDSIANVQTITPVHLTRTVSGETQTISSCSLGTLIATKQGDSIHDSAGNTWTVSNRDGDINNGSINIWAKYKPVKWTDENRGGYFTNDQLVSGGTTWKTRKAIEGEGKQAWWTADDTNHGLSVPTIILYSGRPDKYIEGLDTLPSYIDGGLNGWGYACPELGYPFRLTDFIGYRHDAPEPYKITPHTDDKVSTPKEGNWYYTVQFRTTYNPSADTGDYENRDYIKPTDLKIDGTRWQYCYPGIVIYKKNSSTNKYETMAWNVTGEILVGQTGLVKWEGYTVLDSGPDYSDGVIEYSDCVEAKFKNGETYYAIPVFFTSRKIAQETDGSVQRVGYTGKSYVTADDCKAIPMPYAKFSQFKIIKRPTNQQIAYPDIDAGKVSQLGRCTLAVTLDADSSKGYVGGTFNEAVRVSIVDSQSWNPLDYTQDSVAYDQSFSNIPTIAVDTTYQLVSTTVNDIDISKDWWVRVQTLSDLTWKKLMQTPPLEGGGGSEPSPEIEPEIDPNTNN